MAPKPRAIEQQFGGEYWGVAVGKGSMWGMLWPFAYPSPPFRNVEEFSFNTRPGTRCAPPAVEDPELTSQVGGLHLTITPTGTVGAVEVDLRPIARQSRSQQQIT